MSVLVTGGSGFIGINLCQLLLSEGFKVKIFVRGNRRIPLNVFNEEIGVIKGDIGNLSDIERATKDIEFVFHLAAYVPRTRMKAFDDPLKTFNINSIGALNLLEASRKNDVTNVIYSSTQAVYGPPQYLPIDEEHPTNPETFYGLSKLVGEEYCEQYSRSCGVNFVVLRYSYVYGPFQPQSGVVSLFITKALKKEDIIIEGKGAQTFDFVYVQDVVKANLAAIRASHTFEIFNVGSGKQVSIARLAEKIIKLTGSKSKIKYRETRKIPKHFYLDINKARESLTFSPTSLQKGLIKHVSWLRHRLSSCACYCNGWNETSG